MEDLFSAKSQTCLMHNHFQLATHKKGFQSIPDYYYKAKLLHDNLTAIGKLLSNSKFITFLLAGLGSDFESVITSITTRVDPLTPTQVYGYLLNHEARLYHQTTNLISSLEFFCKSRV